MKLTRAKLESLVDDLILKTRGPGRGRRSRMPASRPHEIDEVVLVGGMTRMPKVQQVVKELFGRAPSGREPGQGGRRRRPPSRAAS